MNKENRIFKGIFYFLMGWLIGTMLVFAFKAHADTTSRTFCQFWDTGLQQDKIQFIFKRGPQIRDALTTKFPDKKAEIDVAMKCYDSEVTDLVATLDKDCKVEKAMSEFFKQQVDTGDQEMGDINDYINQCAQKALKQSN